MMLRWTAATLKGLAKYLLAGAAVALLALAGGAIAWLEGRADLKPWHTAVLSEEFEAESGVADFAGYLALEARLFEQLEREVLDRVASSDRTAINRYHRGSLSDPRIWPRNWNRSYVLAQQAPKAVFVLIHGMSDSPYSLHNLALALHDTGGEVIGLRLPGHGTAPAGLLEARWQDMAAAVALAIAEAQRRAAADRPVYVVGYSIGAALAVHHALAAAESGTRQVEGLVLISPAIGLSPLAGLAAVQARTGRLLGLRKVAWNAIGLEYDPFKYGSFTINAAYQSYLLTEEIQAGFERFELAGRLPELPPVLAFQSAVDATVSSRAVVDDLFRRLPPGRNELVLFDVNQMTDAFALLADDPRNFVEGLLTESELRFTLSLLTNRRPDQPEIVVRRRAAGSKEFVDLATDLAWPRGVFSLSHVALPFPAWDQLYGDGTGHNSPGIELGVLALRGERAALKVSAEDMLRLRWNPFYSYLEERVLDFVGLVPAPR